MLDRSPEDTALLGAIEAAAKPHFKRTMESFRSYDAEWELRAFFDEEVHPFSHEVRGPDGVPCLLCGRAPSSSSFANVVLPRPLRGDRPSFVLVHRDGKASAPALCWPCVERDWKTWDADIGVILGVLREGDSQDRQAGSALAARFQRRPIRAAVGKCDLCGGRGDGLRGVHAFVCARCVADAREEVARQRASWVKEINERRRLEEEEKSRPFPDDLREAARRTATHLGERRARARACLPEPRRGADDGSWAEIRSCLALGTGLYGTLDSYNEKAYKTSPPLDLVDQMAGRVAGLVGSVALDGYRQRHKGRLGEGKSVVGERWVAHSVGAFLFVSRPSPAARAAIDEDLVLLRDVLASGVSYCEWDDQIYEDVTHHYFALVTSLYDYRDPQARALHEGALLLHGGTAEDRLEIAREIHLARTAGLDERLEMPFVLIGSGEGAVPLLSEFKKATVFIPDPLALSVDEQRCLLERLTSGKYAEPTILGAEEEESFRERAQSALLEELVPRLYTFEQDVEREVGARAVPP